VVTWDGITLRYYIDNSEQGTLLIGASPEDTAERIFLGARTGGNGFPLTGALDDVRIYNRALGTLDVLALYALTTDVTPPSAPTGVTATVVSNTQLDLIWSASSDNVGVVDYHIETCVGASCSTWGEVDTSTTPSYPLTGLTPNTTYGIRIRAQDAAGNFSSYSTPIYQTTSATGATAGKLILQIGVFAPGTVR
jgi:hypothetical protein